MSEQVKKKRGRKFSFLYIIGWWHFNGGFYPSPHTYDRFDCFVVVFLYW